MAKKKRKKSTNARKTGCLTNYQSCVRSEMNRAQVKGATQGRVRDEFARAANACRGRTGLAKKGGACKPKPRKKTQRAKQKSRGLGILR